MGRKIKGKIRSSRFRRKKEKEFFSSPELRKANKAFLIELTKVNFLLKSIDEKVLRIKIEKEDLDRETDKSEKNLIKKGIEFEEKRLETIRQEALESIERLKTNGERVNKEKRRLNTFVIKEQAEGQLLDKKLFVL